MRADNIRPSNFENLSEKIKPPTEEKINTPEESPEQKIVQHENTETKDEIDRLERRIQDLNFNGNNIKVEEAGSDLNEIKNIKVEPEEDDLCQSLKEKLDLEDGEEEEGDRIARGPQKFKTNQVYSAPYAKSSPYRHFCGGNVVDTTAQRSKILTYDLFTDISGLNDLPPPYPCVNPPAQFIPELETCSAISNNTNYGVETPSQIDISMKTFLSEFDYQALFKVCEDEINKLESPLDSPYSPPPNSVTSDLSTSPPHSNYQQGSPFIGSVDSSGYESATSTPSSSPGPSHDTSNSPPNHYTLNTLNALSCYEIGDSNIPTTVEEISSPTPASTYQRTTKYCPILPKPILTYTMQENFYKYIVALGNEQILKKVIYMVDKIPKADFKKFADPDCDGDTALMKLAVNPNAIQLQGTSLPGDSPAVRLAFVYAIVQRLERENPRIINVCNNSQQSALHLAATNTPEHPLFAAYLAESLQRNHYPLTQECNTKGCIANGGILIHCLVTMGDTHAEVLRELLNLPGAYKVDHLNSNGLTPLQVAIESAYKNDVKVHKCVKILIENGASLGVKHPSFPHSKPILCALQPGKPRLPDVDLVKAILEAKDNHVNDLNAQNLHPLMATAQFTRHPCNFDIKIIVNLMSLLIKNGARVIKQDNANAILMFFTTEHTKQYNQTISDLLFPQHLRNNCL